MHTLKLSGDIPVNLVGYRTPYNLRDELDKQINLQLESKILALTQSPHSFPVIFVKRADGGYRLVCDFRKLNKKLIGNAYPIPNITET